MAKKSWLSVLEILVEGGQRIIRQINDDKDMEIQSLREENAELLKEIEKRNVQNIRGSAEFDSPNKPV